MRILVVQDADWLKKGPHQQHHLMERLSIKGHEIKVIGYDQLWKAEKKKLISNQENFSRVSRFYKNSNITYVRCAFLRIPVLDYISFLISSRQEIKKTICEFKPDIIIGFTSIISNYWGCYYARRKRIPFVYYWTDVIHTLIPIKRFRSIGKFIEKIIIKESKLVLTINENLRDVVVSMGANPSTTQVITGGIDFEIFNALVNAEKLQKKYNISNDDFVLFFMGWIYEFSGLEEVILEIQKARDKLANIKLIIVGDGDYCSDLKRIVDENNLQKSIIFTGWRPYKEIPQLIALSKICILPSHCNEIMQNIVPIKMYEYLAMNKPVISTKLPGIMKEFGNNNGVIYINKPEEIVNKISELRDKDIIEIQKAAKEFIKKYEWGKITDEFEELLESLINENITSNSLF